MKEDKLEIRAYKYSDKDVVINILRQNTPQYFSPEEEKDLVYYLDNEIDFYFVLELNDEIVGCGGINYADNKTTGKISWDLLDPNFQRKGLGTILLNHRIDLLKNDKEIKKIIVRTSQIVYKFYEKSDFKLFEIVKDYWAEGFDLYNMEYSKL